MARRKRDPSYRHHKASGQAFVEFDGRRIYLGRHGTKRSREEYHRLIAEWLANDQQLPVPPEELKVSELLVRFWRHAEGYYQRTDGTPTGELDCYRQALRPLRRLYGSTLAKDFGPRNLKTVREQFVRGTAPKMRRGASRKTVNSYVARIRRVFRWAVAQELLPASVYEALRAVEGLRYGRSVARETDGVRPVPQTHIDVIEGRVSHQVWAMMQVQLTAGARSGEVCTMRPSDIDRSGRVWVYRPREHKTAHHGHDREILIGPRAQAAVAPFLLGRDDDAFLFSPTEAEEERRRAQHEARTTPPRCGNRPGTNRKRAPKRKPADKYTPDSYRRAIQRAIEAVNREREKVGKEPIAMWHPHQLRHNCAKRLRSEYGIDLARVVLGHRLGSEITEVYAEADRARATEIVAEAG